MGLRSVPRGGGRYVGIRAAVARKCHVVLAAFGCAHHGIPGGRNPLVFQRTSHPRDTTTSWDTGWRFAVACAAGVVLLGVLMCLAATMIGVIGLW